MGVIDGSDHHNNTGCSGQLGNFLVHSHAQEEHSFNFAHNLEMHFCAQGVHYSRTCFLRSPLGPAKASLKQQVVFETRVAETFPCKSNTFLLLKFEVEVYTDISHLYLLFKVYTKGGSKLTQPCNKGHVYSTVVPYSGTCTCKWLCACKIFMVVTGRSAGSCSPQRLFCTKSSMHGISLIKTSRSLTTEIVKSTFHCTWTPKCLDTSSVEVHHVELHKNGTTWTPMSV